MVSRTLVAVALLMTATASASLIEETTDGAVTYQFDGGTTHDAPDRCEDADAAFAVPLGNSTSGTLVPVDDEADHYVVDVDRSLVGSRITIALQEANADVNIDLDIRVPGCGGSVLDEDQQPEDPPEHPDPGPGEQSARLDNLDGGWECDDSSWFFVINQVRGGIAPASIHLVWTDGTQADVPLTKDTPATIAQYETSQNTDVSLHSASAVLPDDWDGRFNIGHGPCDASHGGAVFGEEAEASDDGDRISFTPTQEGTYVAAVVLALQPPDADPMALFQPQPMTCHTCVDGFDGVPYPSKYDLDGFLEK